MASSHKYWAFSLIIEFRILLQQKQQQQQQQQQIPRSSWILTLWRHFDYYDEMTMSFDFTPGKISDSLFLWLQENETIKVHLTISLFLSRQ